MASRPTARAIWTATLVGLSLAQAAAGGAATAPPLEGPAPNFALTTQQNDRLWLTQLRGRAVVLGFGCAACGACPELVPGLADIARDLGEAPGRRVFFALVTVDPSADTPAALREFGRRRGLRAPAWLFLTEDRAGQVDAVARRYGIAVHRTPAGVEADCAVMLIDAAGRIRGRYALASLGQLARDLRALIGLPASR